MYNNWVVETPRCTKFMFSFLGLAPRMATCFVVKYQKLFIPRRGKALLASLSSCKRRSSGVPKAKRMATHYRSGAPKAIPCCYI
jgi:hypothetical protein